jgi:hypothetical protein
MPALLRIERVVEPFEDGAEEVAIDLLRVYDGAPCVDNLLLSESITLDLVSQLEELAVAARAAYERQRIRDPFTPIKFFERIEAL